LDALEEAMYRQTTALECLELERTKLLEKLLVEEEENEDEEEEAAIKNDEIIDDSSCQNNNNNNNNNRYEKNNNEFINEQQQRQNENSNDDDDDDDDDDALLATNKGGGDGGKTKKKKKNVDHYRTSIDRVGARRLELRAKMTKLKGLRQKLLSTSESNNKQKYNNNNKGDDDMPLSILAATVSEFRQIMGSSPGPCSILDRPKDSWKINTSAVTNIDREFGRPRGFTGLVLYSPLGVPILVGKRKTQSDDVLRRIAQGSDLWFQVEDYDGSRVLLRTSLMRGTKNSKRCVQMAADIAAKYSVWGSTTTTTTTHRRMDAVRSVPVMYTDSKHVAKRGTKVGRMRKRKSLGRLMGRPSNVEEITRGLEPY